MDSSANARLEILYRQCYPSLYRYALWALRDHHQAEEAVQAVSYTHLTLPTTLGV